MFLSITKPTLTALVLATAVTATANAATPFTSDKTALAVCRAVLADNSEEVTRLLASERPASRHSLASRWSSQASSGNLKVSFECNGMSLERFADRVGATRTSALLNGSETAAEEQVADTSEQSVDGQI